MNILDLPEIVPADLAEDLLRFEPSIRAKAQALLMENDQAAEQIVICLEALDLISVLEAAHASESLADECPAYAAEQLKLHFLSILEEILDQTSRA
jgi:hypothetical protein